MQLDDVLKRFDGNPPAGADAIRQFESESGHHLPQDYVAFLQRSDGGEGFVGNAYLMLWRVGELREMNEAYAVQEFAPGLLLIGSDGGGEAIGYDMRTLVKPLVAVPFVGMDLKSARSIAPSFHAFLETLFKS
jgi:hypothetical protein